MSDSEWTNEQVISERAIANELIDKQLVNEHEW